MAYNTGGAVPHNQWTPAVTRGGSRTASAFLTATALRGLRQVCITPTRHRYMEITTYLRGI